MDLAEWLLTSEERGNSASAIDDAHPDGQAWSRGNTVRPIVHGRPYFAELHERITAMADGDRLYFADWQGDPDEQLIDDADSTLAATLAAAAARGVDVRGLLWRAHARALGFAGRAHLELADAINAAGGECLRDMRVRFRGAHHQKLVVLRHADDPQRDIAYVGGIDLCHSRRDDERHVGDRQVLPMATAYGEFPAWHDVHVAIQGPGIYDVETTFRERWEDTTPLTLNPGRLAKSLAHAEPVIAKPLGERWPPPPSTEGHEVVQILRTFPKILPRGFDFAPDGERSVMLGNIKAMERAERLVYVEDQYLWSAEVGEHFARALRDNPDLRIIMILPLVPDKDGPVNEPPQLHGRNLAMTPILEAGGDRVAVFGLTNDQGLPIYVHSKTCVIDHRWASVGSDNLNRRSWTSDSEIACVVVDDRGDLDEVAPQDAFPRVLLRALAAEHLGCDPDDVPEDPHQLFDAMVACADALDHFYADSDSHSRQGVRGLLSSRFGEPNAPQGERPPGRLRRLAPPELTDAQALWAPGLYDRIFDPKG